MATFTNRFLKSIVFVVSIMFFMGFPNPISSLENSSGEILFNNYCAGCHINGGNIIRRGKNLKLNALKRNGVDNPEAIATIAREGLGSMSGYEDVLGKEGDQLVANWIWEQAQKAWVQ